MSNRETGTLKFFDEDGGFGFIERAEGEDVFLHITNFAEGEQPDPGQLDEGARLEFAVGAGKEGPEARAARLLEDEGAPTTLSTEELPPFRVPQDTAPLLAAHRDQTQNLALRVEKAVPFEGSGTPDIPSGFSHSNFNRRRIVRRHDEHLRAVRDRPGVEVETISASVDWRLAVGLGRASVYENGITLDATDGMPYVSGSGVKGALRTFLINAVYRPEVDGSGAGEAEAQAFSDQAFCDLFGAPAGGDTHYETARQGSVCFHDAYLRASTKPKVEADIMNPHFQEYYQGTAAPTDDMNPTIITFLTVTEADFTFAASTRENGPPQGGLLLDETPDSHADSRLGLTTYWLRRLLTEWGLGAKTAAGYGFFVLKDEEAD